jgi:hypothetical protein
LEGEEESLEAGRMGSGAREELVRSCGGLLDEAEVGGYTVTGSTVEMPVIHSSAYRDPSAASPGLATLYGLQVGTMDQYWTTHHTDRLTGVLDRTRQCLVALEQLAYSTCVAGTVLLRSGAVIDPAAPCPARVLYGQAVLEPYAADLFGEAHLPTLVKVEADQQEQRSVAAKADD